MAEISGNDEKVVATHIPDTAVDPVVHESHYPEKISASKYATTRLSTLKPPMHHAPNPFRLLAMLSGKQWLFFLVGFFAWVNLSPQTRKYI